MKPIFFSTERGQTLILITLAAIGLFAIVGLAVDGTAKFSERRHAQNTADTTTLTGSLSLLNPVGTNVVSGSRQQWRVDALYRAESNGYDRDFLTNRIWVYRCSDPTTEPNSLRYQSPVDCRPYDGQSNYIQMPYNRRSILISPVFGIMQ